jgi:hypothetical protein
MEFLRFGSSIPGSYWGCCAFDIIQNFGPYDPDDPLSIEMVCGDEGQPLEGKFLGKTAREVFEARLVVGTFGTEHLPNHGFLAVLTESQLETCNGKAWMEILADNGFEFIRAVSNSIYSGEMLYKEGDVTDRSVNYLFGLFRNIGSGKVTNPFEPPKGWQGLLSVHQDNTLCDSLHRERYIQHESRYKTYTEEELDAEGVPVTYAGVRSLKPQQLRKYRVEEGGEVPPTPAPFI